MGHLFHRADALLNRKQLKYFYMYLQWPELKMDSLEGLFLSEEMRCKTTVYPAYGSHCFRNFQNLQITSRSHDFPIFTFGFLSARGHLGIATFPINRLTYMPITGICTARLILQDCCYFWLSTLGLWIKSLSSIHSKLGLNSNNWSSKIIICELHSAHSSQSGFVMYWCPGAFNALAFVIYYCYTRSYW